MTNRSLSSTLDRMWTLNHALDQALSAGFDRTQRGPQLWVPAMDVAEKADAYLINVELPGVEPNQVEINFEQNVLTVRGTKPSSFEVSNGEYRVYTAERVSGEFERAVRLPDFVDSERIEASYSHGLLRILVPKAQAAQPRKIEIRAGTPERTVTAGTS
ncbi:MAG: Hsp20/alpha crystallin family protein [Gemmatimonadota bacterium]|nr:Hsp20/alpha crystallin family protein [Gemmatimonadota bacterium]